MHAEPRAPLQATVAAGRLMSPALAFALVAALLAAPLLLFAGTTWSMIEIWIRAQTFNHCFLVLPIFLWLVWGDRARLASLPARPFWPGLLAVVGCGALWLAGELASAIGPAQWAVVLLVPALVLTVAGVAWARALALPLAFLLFAVPFGEVFVPTLIDWTADFTVLALQASGVPVYREGNHFIIPSGAWSVVEACSGIRYLIASLMVGTIYAWLMYRSTRKRVLFIIAAILTPIVANWLRAYLIVMLGHLSNNEIATGVDHIIYGWIFFGLVMLLMFWVGSFWREDPPAGSAPAAPAPAPLAVQPLIRVAAAALALMVLPVVAQAALEAQRDTRPVQRVGIAPRAGWTLVEPGPAAWARWRPHIHGASVESHQVFEKDGKQVGVYLGVYRNQTQDRELVNALNQLVTAKDSGWRVLDRGRFAPAAGDPAQVARARISGPGGAQEVWHWYWLGQFSTPSDVAAKLDLARERLLGASDTSAWVSVHTPAGESSAAAQATLDQFMAEMGPALGAALEQTAAR